MDLSQLKGRNVLVLGGTGAMGVYVVPELAKHGCKVCVVSLDERVSDDPLVTYVKGNALDDQYLAGLMRQKFDAVIDFMLYGTEQFRARHEIFLNNTAHYIFLSSYRIYSGGVPVTEDTPRLLDVSLDKEFLQTEDYSLYKARQENILQASKFTNWTIVRPAITYSKFRYQLVTLEAPVVIARTVKGLPLVLPKAALTVQGTMNWAGDVAKMFSRLLFNPLAYRECFTLATAEHHAWGEIAEYYRELIGLEYVAADTDDYIKIMGGSCYARYQLCYDRLFDRVIDNSKILRVTGLKQSELMPLKEGLAMELAALPRDTVWPDAAGIWQNMDAYLKK